MLSCCDCQARMEDEANSEGYWSHYVLLVFSLISVQWPGPHRASLSFCFYFRRSPKFTLFPEFRWVSLDLWEPSVPTGHNLATGCLCL